VAADGAAVRYETAVVTGASRGLGLAVANALAERGLRVVAASRTPPPGGLEWVEADLSSPASIAWIASSTLASPTVVIVCPVAGSTTSKRRPPAAGTALPPM